MCYLVTGVNPNAQSNAVKFHAIYDTEEEARSNAERLARQGLNELAVWKQIAVPKIVQTVTWEGSDA